MKTEENSPQKFDRLGRTREIEVITSLIKSQSAKRTEHSFVLALDAKYGAGKSFMLDLLSTKLGADHPVARVDAWADDTGNEPTVSIMAAIEETLEPFFDEKVGKKIREKFGAVRRNILPIVAKGAGGALSKAIARYVGEAVKEELAELLVEQSDPATLNDDEAVQSVEAEAGADGAEAAVDAIGSALTELADQHAKGMIADYRKRKNSRESFKLSMAELIRSLSKRDGNVDSPLVVIVDELDRCRPDYAIKVLEEIKHFFDVPGVAFVLAINREQLARSIKAVYGTEFESGEYLRRFFDFSLGLVEKSFEELIEDQCLEHAIEKESLRSPPGERDSENTWSDHARHISRVLSALEASARETKATIQNLSLFVDTWPYPAKVELTLAIPLLLSKVRGEGFNTTNLSGTMVNHSSPWFEHVSGADMAELFRGLNEAAGRSLQHSSHGPERGHFAADYIRLVFSEEFQVARKLYEKPEGWRVPSSFASKYREHISFLREMEIN